MAGHRHGSGELFERGIDIASGQRFLRRIGDRMNQKVDRAPGFLDLAEGGVHAGRVRHIAWHDEIGAHFGGQRLDPLFQRIALIGEGKLGACIGAGLGDSPGDRPVVGDTHYEAAFARHQLPGSAHDSVLG